MSRLSSAGGPRDTAKRRLWEIQKALTPRARRIQVDALAQVLREVGGCGDIKCAETWPPWPEMPEAEREHWRALAQRVLDEYTRKVTP